MSKLSFALTLFLVACGGSQKSAPVTTETTPPPEAKPALELEVFTANEAGFLVTSTIIMGPTEAIVIDAQFTLSQGRALAERIAASGRTLKLIYVTHAHPDHYFGAEAVLAKFPDARLVTAANQVPVIQQMGPAKHAYWKPIYKDDLTNSPLVPEALEGDLMTVDGQAVRVIHVDQADMTPATIVHVPALGAVIAGDLVFDEVHVWLAETDAAARQRWIASLQKIKALAPTTVVAGHKQATSDDAPASLDATATYISDFDETVTAYSGAEAAKAAVLGKYNTYALPIILDIALGAAYPAKK